MNAEPTHLCPIKEGAAGLISADWCIDTFAERLRQLPPDLTQADITRPELKLWSEKGWSIYYVPFERVNPAARVLLVGLTPGRRQMWEATMAAAEALRNGASIAETLDAASRRGAFAGPMRDNLVKMLDLLGVARWLGLETTKAIWTDEKSFWLESGTSAVLHAVFRNTVRKGVLKVNENYGDDIMTDSRRFPILGSFVDQVLAADFALVPDALIIPLGVSVNHAVSHLIVSGKVKRERVLEGLPHPSPAYPYMWRDFELRREELTERVAGWAMSHPL